MTEGIEKSQNKEALDFLKESYQEEMPLWLSNFNKNDKIDMKDVLSSRVLYYPGAGVDGCPVKLFNQSHSIHTFIYADYGIKEERMDDEMNTLLGYTVLEKIRLTPSDLCPNGWKDHSTIDEKNLFLKRAMVNTVPYASFYIFQRDEGFDDTHGAFRFALLVIGGDGFATYDALFCQPSSFPLFALILQDHGFGGNYERFGRRGLLERIAKRANVFPTFIMAEDRENAFWDGYEKIENVTPHLQGMHGDLRYFYK